MKKLFFVFILFVASASLAGLLDSLSGLIGAGAKAEDLCKKLVKVDQQDCFDNIKGKQYRSEFVTVCEGLFKKNRTDADVNKLVNDCLAAITNKSTPQASSEQAEFCAEMINSNSRPNVLNCLKLNVVADFAKYCGNFIKTDKRYNLALNCMQAASDENMTTVDMKRFASCKMEIVSIKVDHIDCLINSQKSSSNGGDSIKTKFDAAIEKGSQQ